MKTPRPLQVSCATDIELTDLVIRSQEFGPDFRDHIHAEFARRFPYIEVSTLASGKDRDVFLRTEGDRMIEHASIITTPEYSHD